MHQYSVIDAHCDTASELLNRKERLTANSGHLSLAQMENYHGYLQFFAAWVGKEEKNPMLRAVEIFDNLTRELSQSQGVIEKVTSAKKAREIMEQGKRGALFTLEDGRSLCGSLASLRMFYDLGVRALTLAWNDDNELTDGIMSERGDGLTKFGKLVVREMNRLHMMVDISHITERGFWDVLETTVSPVFASHSNAKSICSHKRNLTDEQITALIQSRGMVCVSVYPAFLTNSGSATISDVLRHTDHILSLGGEQCLGLGSDFDGVDTMPEGFAGAAHYEKLFHEMSKVGYSDDLIAKITHKNLLNFMERIEI